MVGNHRNAGGELARGKWGKCDRVGKGRYTFDRFMIKRAGKVTCGEVRRQYEIAVGGFLLTNRRGQS